MSTESPHISASASLAERFGDAPTTALILGSGVGSLIDRLDEVEARLPYADVGIPSTGVTGHSGAIAVGRLGGERIAVLAGRMHLYEGRPRDEWACAVRALARWGVKRLLLTSAVGSLRVDLPPGSLVRITDHVNLTGTNPLIGPNDATIGPRFPDLSTAYDAELGAALDATAAEQGLALQTGVYMTMSGPSYETPAEVRMLAALGGAVVGMTLAPEVIIAVHAGLRVAAVSTVSNMGCGLTDEPADHSEVMAVVEASNAALCTLIEGTLARW